MQPDEAGSWAPPAALVERIAALPVGGRRRLVAVAGVPASGKSTLAAGLTDRLQRAGRRVENVPMDGFHLDNRLLDPMGLRARKGAPETFDAEGFLALMRRLQTDEQVYYPLFDRSQDQAIAGAGVVANSCELVIVEGNYLLFDQTPWDRLSDLWDLSIWIDTPEEVVRARCIQRWLDHGHTHEAATQRAEQNDLRNARLIAANHLPADVTLDETSDVARP